MAVFEDVSKLSAEEFQRMVGISLEIFLIIVATVYNVKEQEKQEKPIRKRGRKPDMSMENKVFFFIIICEIILPF